MTTRRIEIGMRALISYGSYTASCIVFKKIHDSTILSHHFHSIPGRKKSNNVLLTSVDHTKMYRCFLKKCLHILAKQCLHLMLTCSFDLGLRGSVFLSVFLSSISCSMHIFQLKMGSPAIARRRKGFESWNRNKLLSLYFLGSGHAFSDSDLCLWTYDP